MANNWMVSPYFDYLNICWNCLEPHCVVGTRDRWIFRPFCIHQRQSLCTALTAGKCLPLGLCKGTVKGSSRYVTWEEWAVHDALALRSLATLSDLLVRETHTRIVDLETTNSHSKQWNWFPHYWPFVRGIHRLRSFDASVYSGWSIGFEKRHWMW